MSAPIDTALVLESDEAWALLRSRTVGRLAVSRNGQPEIFPVNFLADERSILIKTSNGAKMQAIAVNQRVAFEADDYNSDRAWSVVVKGTARRLTDGKEVAHARASALWTWVPGATDVFVRITPTQVTGRYFRRE